MIIENSKQQIMILAHNRNLIDYLFNKIELDNISSVGKYVGGMKQEHLKESETKQIILGTYSMASEGLDIKTLTTLILATPKSDVVQSVGRILRVKDNNPIVVDIVDIHSIFENQYLKRQTFYKQNNYKIIGCNNFNYSCDVLKWKILFEPLIKEKSKENLKEDEKDDNKKVEKRKNKIEILLSQKKFLGNYKINKNKTQEMKI
jgi:superfamily II DNA or RNA helicase